MSPFFEEVIVISAIFSILSFIAGCQFNDHLRERQDRKERIDSFLNNDRPN